MKKTITSAERLQLLGLLTLAVQYHQKLTLVEKGMADLLEHNDPYVDHLSDAIYEDDLDIDGILDKMQVRVNDLASERLADSTGLSNPPNLTNRENQP